jgi:hypothetical protein
MSTIKAEAGLFVKYRTKKAASHLKTEDILQKY